MRYLLLASLTLAVVLVPTPASASSPGWIVECVYSHSGADDPIIFPGQSGASHLHDFLGHTGMNADSTYTTVIADPTATSCPVVSGDTAGYWTPALYEDGNRILPAGEGPFGRETRQRFYYRKSDGATITPFPPGFAMVIGNSTATSVAENPWLGRRIYWGCSDNDVPSGADQRSPVDCPGTGIITVHFDFPQCWDGTYTPFVNEVPEMLYPSDGQCPAGYVHLPRLIERFEWPVGTSTETITLASGPYFTAHADFVNTWQPGRLEQLVADCLNADVNCGAFDEDTALSIVGPSPSMSPSPSPSSGPPPHPGPPPHSAAP
jgi:hypothetical protein